MLSSLSNILFFHTSTRESSSPQDRGSLPDEFVRPAGPSCSQPVAPAHHSTEHHHRTISNKMLQTQNDQSLLRRYIWLSAFLYKESIFQSVVKVNFQVLPPPLHLRQTETEDSGLHHQLFCLPHIELSTAPQYSWHLLIHPTIAESSEKFCRWQWTPLNVFPAFIVSSTFPHVLFRFIYFLHCSLHYVFLCHCTPL